jgi:pyruvate dehydrogenase E2 component (dihydrolipoamide acetyltransferase)
MSYEMVMPQLGISMDYGQIVEWVKKSGELVKIGDPVFRVESDKTTVEIEAVVAGAVHITLEAGAEEIPVGTVVGYILEPGEKVPEKSVEPVDQKASIEKAVKAPQTAMSLQGNSANLSASTGRRLPSSPAARRRAQELKVDWQLATGSGPAGRIKVRDIEILADRQTSAFSLPGPKRISPVAQRLAESVGLDMHSLALQFPNTRIERIHVEQTIRSALQHTSSGPQHKIAADEIGDNRHDAMGGIRRLISERMVSSHQTSAPVTMTIEVDATELIRIRKALKNDAGEKTAPSYNAMLAKLCARALNEHPELNASIDSGEIITHSEVNIGIAVDTESGLVVPVIKDVYRKTLEEIAWEMDDVLTRSAQGKAQLDELTGGTFTITNLGRYEVDSFTPIINLPECAILGVGRLIEKVVALDGEMTIRTMMMLSLTFDHRLVDGAPAARFFQRIKQFVEQPYLWLISE